MCSAAIWVVMATVAVEYGYEAMPDGTGLRYVILVEPEMLDSLNKGEPVGSTILPEALGRIREFRIVSRYGPLSKEIPPLAGPPAALATPPKMPWLTQPVTEGKNSDSVPKLLPDATMVHQVSGVQDAPPTGGPNEQMEPAGEAIQETKSPKTDPWFLFVLASVIAVGSSSGMLVFGWLTFDYRSRYLGLLRESMGTGESWLGTVTDPDPLSSKSVDLPIGSEEAAAEISTDAAADDSAWDGLGVETKDSVEDWLQEDRGQRNGSRPNRKKSR